MTLFFGKKPVKQEQNSQTVALLKANLSPDLVARGGGDITIVDDMALLAETGPLGTIADVGETPQNGQIFKYVVREEDSLLSISKMFDGVSVNTIRWANNLTTSTVIRPGQILIIFPIDSIQHTVAKNETFEGIVKRYGATSTKPWLSTDGLPVISRRLERLWLFRMGKANHYPLQGTGLSAARAACLRIIMVSIIFVRL